MFNSKKGYIEPANLTPDEQGADKRCRFCDMPGNKDDLGPVIRDGTTIDGSQPLFSHVDCLMNAGGQKKNIPQLGLAASKKENIWDFADKFRFITAAGEPEADSLYKIPKIKTPRVQPMTQTDTPEQYDRDQTGATIPPSN